jgi:hypothetical protein
VRSLNANIAPRLPSTKLFSSTGPALGLPRIAPDTAAAGALGQWPGTPDEGRFSRKSLSGRRSVRLFAELLERHARNHRRHHGTSGPVSSSTIFRGSPGISPNRPLSTLN